MTSWTQFSRKMATNKKVLFFKSVKHLLTDRFSFYSPWTLKHRRLYPTGNTLWCLLQVLFKTKTLQILRRFERANLERFKCPRGYLEGCWSFELIDALSLPDSLNTHMLMTLDLGDNPAPSNWKCPFSKGTGKRFLKEAVTSTSSHLFTDLGDACTWSNTYKQWVSELENVEESGVWYRRLD